MSSDEEARRALADQVRETVSKGLQSVSTVHGDVAMAAFAAIISSDLRAPADAIATRRRLSSLERKLAIAERWLSAETVTDYKLMRALESISESRDELRALIENDNGRGVSAPGR